MGSIGRVSTGLRTSCQEVLGLKLSSAICVLNQVNLISIKLIDSKFRT